MLAVLVPITLVTAALSGLAIDLLPELAGSNFLSDWVGEAATSMLLSPVYAVAAVLITLELSGSRLAR